MLKTKKAYPFNFFVDLFNLFVKTNQDLFMQTPKKKVKKEGTANHKSTTNAITPDTLRSKNRFIDDDDDEDFSSSIDDFDNYDKFDDLVDEED